MIRFRVLLPPTESQLSPAKAFFMGVLASAIAIVIIYPILVVQTKARVSLAIIGAFLLFLSFSCLFLAVILVLVGTVIIYPIQIV